jgi:K+-sensing histidine kinase KdpD
MAISRPTSNSLEDFAARVRNATPLIRYSIGLGFAISSISLRFVLNPYWGLSVPLITFFPGVLVAAWLGGLGSGLIATAVCALAADYFWLAPLHSFRLDNVGETFALALFMLTGAMTSVILNTLAETKKTLAQESAERARNEDRLRVVQRIVDTTILPLKVEDLLKDLLHCVRDALKCDSATALLLEDDGAHLKPVASAGFEEEIREPVVIPIGKGVAGQIALSSTGIIFNDLTNVEIIGPLSRAHLHSIVGVPLRIGEKLLGVIHAGSVSSNRFSQDDAVILRLVADRAALAIQRTKLTETEHEARLAAEAATRSREMFLAMASHELRSPLQGIMGGLQVLKKIAFSEDANRILDLIERNAQTQSRLVQDLVEMSLISTGHLTLSRLRAPLRPIIETCLQSMQPKFDEKHLNIHWTKSGKEKLLFIDPDRMQQVLLNLLSNAAKFTDSGGWIKLHLDEQNDSQAEITITDSGAGIDPDFLPHVFSPFRQSDTHQRRNGMGLGLAIVKSLVELHGGKIQVRSEGLEKGSTFVICLPIEQPVEEDVKSRYQVPTERAFSRGSVDGSRSPGRVKSESR